MTPGSVIFGSYHHGVFEPDVPNATTRAAMEQARGRQIELPFDVCMPKGPGGPVEFTHGQEATKRHFELAGQLVPARAVASGNPKDLIGDTKPQLHLNPQVALLRMAKVFELGAEKYGPYNWRSNAVRMTVYLSAAMRHLAAMNDGQSIDPESGQPHAAHVMACMAIVMDAASGGNLIDDREMGGKAADVIASLSEKRA